MEKSVILGADFYLGLLELSARLNVLLSTTKVEFSLFVKWVSLLLKFYCALWQNNLLAFSAETLLELVSFSMIN